VPAVWYYPVPLGSLPDGESAEVRPLKEQGRWWLPGFPDDKLTGELTFTPGEGVRLALEGYFRDDLVREVAVGTTLPSYDLIYGLLKGRLVTLSQCRVTGQGMAMPGYVRTNLFARFAVFEVHLPAEEEITSPTIAVEFLHLRDWINRSGVTMKVDFVGEDERFQRFAIEYTHPEPAVAEVDGLTVLFQPAAETTRRPLREHAVTETFRIKATSDRPKSVDGWLSEVVVPLQRFLMLATSADSGVVDLFLYVPDDRPSDPSGLRRCPVAHSAVEYQSLPERLLLDHEMLFRLDDIADELSTVLWHWFRLGREVESVLDLCFFVAYRPGIATDQRFFNIVRA